MLDRIGQPKFDIWGNVKDFARKAYQEIFDPDNPVNKVVDAVTNGKPLPEANNPRFLRRFRGGSPSSAQYAVERDMVDLQGNKVGPGLKAITDFTNPADRKGFVAFAVAKWAVEKALQAKETGADVIQAATLAGNPGQIAKYGKAFNDLVGLQNQSLKWLRDAGMVSDEGYANMVRENGARIPGYRVDDEGVRQGSETGGAAGNSVRKFFGSKEKIQDPIKSIAQDLFVRAKLARTNIANRAVVDLLAPYGLAEMVRKVPHKFELTPAELKKLGATEETGEIWRMLGHDLRNNEVPIWRNGELEAWHVFKDPVTGKTDTEIVNYLRNMPFQQHSVLTQIMRPLAAFQPMMIVTNPLFPVKLMTYDIPWQFITKPGMRNTLADYFVGLRAIVGKTAEYDDYLRSGAAERVFAGLSKEQFIKDLMAGREDPSMARAARNVVQYPMEKLRAWNQIVSQGIKVGRYVRGVRSGETPGHAAIAASEAAFHRANFGGPVTKALNQVHPFTAAYMNGLKQTFQSLITGTTTSTGDQIKAWQTWMKASAIITVPALANWAASKDEEWYRAVPEWQKNTGLNFHVGNTVLYVPFPPILGFVFGGLPKQLLEGYYRGKGAGEVTEGLLGGLAESFAPSAGLLLAGNVLQPVIEHIANYSFFRGRPLTADDTVLPSAAGSPYSTGIAKTISRVLPDALHASPQVVDNYINGWSGTMGTQATRTLDLLFGTGPRANNPPPLGIADLPFMGSWTARYPAATAQPIIDFGDATRQFQQVHGSLVRAVKTGDMALLRSILDGATPTEIALHFGQLRLDPEAAAMFADHPEEAAYLQSKVQTAMHSVDLDKLNTILGAQKALSVLHEMATRIAAAPTTATVPQISEPSDRGMPEITGQQHGLSGTDKGQLLDRIYGWMQRISERGLEASGR